MNNNLKIWKLIIGWPIFLFIIFRTFLIYRKLHSKKKSAKYRILEQKRYFWCRRYGKILFWFFSSKFTTKNLDKWVFGSSCLITNSQLKILPLIFIKLNDFKKKSPLSFFFTRNYLKSLPRFLRHFYLILNYFVFDENNTKLSHEIINNLKIPRSLLVVCDQSPKFEQISNLLTSVVSSSLSNLHLVNINHKLKQITIDFETNYSPKTVLHINQKFLVQQINNFLIKK